MTASSPTGALLDGRTPIRVDFDEPIVAAPGDVTVVLDTIDDVPGEVSVSGSALFFTPTTPLRQFGSYEVTVRTGVADLSANPLAAEHVFSFEVPATGNAGLASTRPDAAGSGDATCPHLAMDAAGNAMVLFARNTELYTAYYRAGAGFEPTAKLADGREATLAMSPGGRAAVAYTAIVGGDPRILVRSTGLGDSVFGAPETADEDAPEPIVAVSECDLSHHGKSVAVNDAGAIVVAWRTFRDTGGDGIVGVLRNVRSAAGVWGTPDFDSTYPFVHERHSIGVAIDALGNARVLVASASIGTEYELHEYDAAAELWSQSSAGEFGSTTAPRIAIDLDGDFVRAFALDVGGTARIAIDTEDADGVDPRPNLAQDIGTYALDVHLSVAHGIWATWSSNGSLGVARFAGEDENWTTHPTLVAAAGEPNAAFPMIAGVGDSREAILMWEREDAIRWTSIVVGEFGEPGSGSLRTLPIDGIGAAAPRMVFDAGGGHGILVWLETQPTGVELRATQFHNFPPAD